MSAIVQRRKRYRPTPIATARVNAKKANLKLPRRYHTAKPAIIGSIKSVYGFIVPTMVPRAKSRIPSFFEYGRPLTRGISELFLQEEPRCKGQTFVAVHPEIARDAHDERARAIGNEIPHGVGAVQLPVTPERGVPEKFAHLPYHADGEREGDGK